ncbi:hypothetical protein TRFO_27184 [Tritrichomonas foetus]|uniref:Chromo domain-containing protein n=1 Tax=Tritrichomonas foetus TaxID=1144522 RepID=A0A1J4K6T9_9EUKA|nr:hypothetical protein TRFO_27184 [Tritrichomonas foetus]|eukprot:OHT05173.1 hypothetical protein TRFO_27184 [Tritrichomonas foetus]
MSSEQEEESDYEVEEIIKHRKTSSGYTYYLKWKGFPSSANTWEKEKNLACPELLKKYWDDIKAQEGKKKQKKRSLAKRAKKKKLSKEKVNNMNILACRKDYNDEFIFLIEKPNGKKEEYNMDYLKVKYKSVLIRYFESIILTTSTINVKSTQISNKKNPSESHDNN